MEFCNISLQRIINMKNPIITSTGNLIVTSIVIIITSAIITSFLGYVFYGLIFDSGVFTNPSFYFSGNYSNPEVVSFTKSLQISQSIGMFIIPPFLIVFLSRTDLLNDLSLKVKPNTFIMVLTGVVMITALPLIDMLGEFNSKMVLPEFLSGVEAWMRDAEESTARITKIFLTTNGVSDLFVNLIMIALIPAVGEELMFRGFLQNYISKKLNVHLAIVITAFIFSAIHMQFFGFIPRFLMGMLFGYLLHWSGSLWLPMFAHFVNNGTAVLISYFIGYENASSDKLLKNNDNYIYIVVSSIILTFSAIFLIYKYYSFFKQNKDSILNQ